MPYRQLCGSCGTDKKCVFLHLGGKMSGQFLEQQIKIKLCVKSGRNASDTSAVLYEACGGEVMEKSSIL
jgi:hypothetical protein